MGNDNSGLQPRMAAGLLIALLAGCGGGGGGASGQGGGNGGGASQPPPPPPPPPPPVVINDNAPTISGAPPGVARVGESYLFSPTTSDPDGNSLLFTAENLPSWAWIDPGTGVVSGTPVAASVGNQDDITISVSDGKYTTQLEPFRISVVYPPVSREDISPAPSAQVTATAEGYDLAGDATLTIGGLVTDLTNGDLKFRFDSSGRLIGMTGTVDVPQRIAPMLTAQSTTHVAVGLYSGAELNASADMGPNSISGILLRDEAQYMVFFLSADSSFTFTGPSSRMTPISLSVGSAQSLLITDPTDPLFYLFGYVDGTGFGSGNSEHGLIPWRAVFDDADPDAFPALQPFSGTDVHKGTMPLGFKVLDLLQITGTGVCSPPPPFKSCELDWVDLLASLANDDLHLGADQQVKVGINGEAVLKLSLFNIDLFAYRLLTASVQVDHGLDHQHTALQGVYEPVESQQPVWLPVRPSADPDHKVVANLLADADLLGGGPETYALELRGTLHSEFPPATLSGSMRIDPTGTSYSATVPSPTNPITVTAHSGEQQFDALVQYGADLSSGIQQIVSEALDRELARVQSAYADLQQATSDYEFEASLRGIRQLLPGIADTTTAYLNGVPGQARATAQTAAGSAYDTYCTFPCNTLVSRSTVVAQAGDQAAAQATGQVSAAKSAMAAMKAAAQQADDASLRNALQQSLLTAYGYRQVQVHVTVTYDFPVVGARTLYNNTLVYTTMSADNAARIQLAASYVPNIQTTSDLKIQAQAIYDALPAESTINQVKQGVAAGTEHIPAFGGAGYTVTRAGDRTAWVLLDGEPVGVEFNLLDSSVTESGVGDAMATVMTQPN